MVSVLQRPPDAEVYDDYGGADSNQISDFNSTTNPLARPSTVGHPYLAPKPSASMHTSRRRELADPSDAVEQGNGYNISKTQQQLSTSLVSSTKEEEDDGQSDSDESDGSVDVDVDEAVLEDIEQLENNFPDFRERYRLIKRIGEGTFSTVYKAEDLQYEHNKRSPEDDQHRQYRYVAVKKIYVTSGPSRILNELELLHSLRGYDSVCPLLTAFRHTDQIIAVLPYVAHTDFRHYYREMTVIDTATYMRSLFTGLKCVHEHRILHRDIKPTNFLYNPSNRRGVLVDFGLAEREGSESKPCLCHESTQVRRLRIENSVVISHNTSPQSGYPKTETRPARRANRAGTRGFRAPEVLFKCTQQSTKIDIWSAGVILLTILSKRFPFFNSADDVDAMIEIATIFGYKEMRKAGLIHGCVVETSIPTIGTHGFDLEKIILWSTCRTENSRTGTADQPLTDGEKLAIEFLRRCLTLDPIKRISAREALEHPFLQMAVNDSHGT